MKILLLLNCIFFSVLSGCKSGGNEPPTPSLEKPEIDFSQNKFFTLDEILSSKTSEDCGKTHYWESKPLSLQGYVSYVDKNKRIFTLHSSSNYYASTTASGNVAISSMDSTEISLKLNQALNKKCFVKTICGTSRAISGSSCQETLIPKLMSADDIELR